MKKNHFYTFLFFMIFGLYSLYNYIHSYNIPYHADEIAACQDIFPDANNFVKYYYPLPHYKAFKTLSGTNDKKLVGVSVITTEIAPDIMGYSGEIKLMLGVNLDGKITKLYLLSHNETNSYFNNVDKFLKQFSNKSINDSFILGKDIDGITQATVSSNAMTKAVRLSTNEIANKLFKNHLISQTSSFNIDILIKIIIPIILFFSGILSILLQNRKLKYISIIFVIFFIAFTRFNNNISYSNKFLSTKNGNNTKLKTLPNYDFTTKLTTISNEDIEKIKIKLKEAGIKPKESKYWEILH